VPRNLRDVTHILAQAEPVQAVQMAQAAEQVGFLPGEALGLGALKIGCQNIK